MEDIKTINPTDEELKRNALIAISRAKSDDAKWYTCDEVDKRIDALFETPNK